MYPSILHDHGLQEQPPTLLASYPLTETIHRTTRHATGPLEASFFLTSHSCDLIRGVPERAGDSPSASISTAGCRSHNHRGRNNTATDIDVSFAHRCMLLPMPVEGGSHICHLPLAGRSAIIECQSMSEPEGWVCGTSSNRTCTNFIGPVLRRSINEHDDDMKMLCSLYKIR